MKRILSAAAAAAVVASAGAAGAADLAVETITAGPATQQGGFYATFFAGGSLPEAKVTAYDGGVPVGITFDVGFDTGYIVGGAIGREILDNLRGEVEFSVVSSEVSELLGGPVPDGAMKSTGYNLLANLWYDIDTGTAFTPYLGGGVGYGYDVLSSDFSSDESNTSGLLYQLGAGINYAVTEDVSLGLGYRYRVQPDAEVTDPDFPMGPGDKVVSSATNHIVQAGVTFSF
ncbi:outer membrane beta-barrel protein [Devosia sp. ZB163]|uniref:outer membrane protein n=1 Tax=Devosia sp. ZB163 TaxID=3025938 RepID=UPI002362E82D|nr:outer membrane beta-barrel protein [Devosia sp. ZB163]MDC9824025.1 outer membrane beta-barrel protein [Devosia sp. ZB163]